MAPKDLSYVIDLLENQAFSSELLMKQVSEGVPEWANELVKINQELVQEIRTLRQFEETSLRSTSSSVPHSSSSTTAAPTPVVSINSLNQVVSLPVSSQERLQRLRDCLSTAVPTEDGGEPAGAVSDLKAACGMILMYLNKIVDEPLVPRYRKISTTNQNFISLVQPVKNYDSIFTSLGFERKGNFFHYLDPNQSPAAAGGGGGISEGGESSAAESDASSLDVMRAAIKLLEEVRTHGRLSQESEVSGPGSDDEPASGAPGHGR
jgi:PUB domain